MKENSVGELKPRAMDLVERPSLTTLAELRSYADSIVAAQALLKLERSEALLHLLRTVEVLGTVDAIRSAEWPQFDPEGPYLDLRFRQDVLRFAVYKVFERCSAGKSRPLSGAGDIEVAQEAMKCFEVFAALQDSILATEMDYFEVSFAESAREIRFVWKDERIARSFSAVRDGGINRYRDLGETHEEEYERVASSSTFKKILSETKLDRGRLLFTYPDPINFLEEFASIVSDMEEPSEVPLDWSVGSYRLKEFDSFWMALKAISLVHGLVLGVATRASADNGWTIPPLNGASIPLSDSYLTKVMRKHADLAPDVTRQIIRDLTYSPELVPQVDVLYQPLVPVETGHYISIPTLLGGGNHLRNFLAFVDRIPWRQSSVEGLKEKREEFMLGKIEPLCQRKGFRTRRRLRLGPSGKPHGDIDLLVWSIDGKDALALSLKWFNGPDSVREVASVLYQKSC